MTTDKSMSAKSGPESASRNPGDTIPTLGEPPSPAHRRPVPPDPRSVPPQPQPQVPASARPKPPIPESLSFSSISNDAAVTATFPSPALSPQHNQTQIDQPPPGPVTNWHGEQPNTFDESIPLTTDQSASDGLSSERRLLPRKAGRGVLVALMILLAPALIIAIPDRSVSVESAEPPESTSSSTQLQAEPAAVAGPSTTEEPLSGSPLVGYPGYEAAFTLSTITSTTSVDTDDSTTTAAPTTVEPESEWKDAGHGVRLPDVLLRIRFCESTNNYGAAHSYSSARGAYQFLSGSWRWYGHADRYGASTADKATPAQQDEAAIKTWQADGTRPWLASRSCWSGQNINPNYATHKITYATVTTTTSPPPATTTTTTAETTTTSTEPETTTSSTEPESTTSSTEAETTTTTTESTTTTDPNSTTTTSSESTTTTQAPEG